jgi:predicted nuclease with RNAse H fold
MKIIGIDLAGKDKNPTGFCVMTDSGTEARLLRTDEDILKAVEEIEPDVIAVDAPFSFPKEGYYRDSDVRLQEEGFKPLSPVFRGMRPLVERAMKLVPELRKNYRVIEVFPRATEKILGLEEKKTHEYDALLCALTGKYYFQGKFRSMGKEGIVVPAL